MVPKLAAPKTMLKPSSKLKRVPQGKTSARGMPRTMASDASGILTRKGGKCSWRGQCAQGTAWRQSAHLRAVPARQTTLPVQTPRLAPSRRPRTPGRRRCCPRTLLLLTRQRPRCELACCQQCRSCCPSRRANSVREPPPLESTKVRNSRHLKPVHQPKQLTTAKLRTQRMSVRNATVCKIRDRAKFTHVRRVYALQLSQIPPRWTQSPRLTAWVHTCSLPPQALALGERELAADRVQEASVVQPRSLESKRFRKRIVWATGSRRRTLPHCRGIS